MAKKPLKKTSSLKLVGLLRSTISTWKSDFSNYSKVVLVIALPAAIINILQNQGIVGEFGLILSFAWSFVIIAVLLLAQKNRGLADTRLSTIFTAASSRLLQYIGVSLTLIVFALPAITGVLGLFLALPVLGLSPVFFIPLGLVGIILGAYLLCRYCLAQTITVNSELSVISSFKKSAELTQRNRIRIFIAYTLLVVATLLVLTLVQFILGLNQSVNENAIIGGAVYVLEAVVLVPIFFIFQQKIYESLNEKV